LAMAVPMIGLSGSLSRLETVCKLTAMTSRDVPPREEGRAMTSLSLSQRRGLKQV
jgi:hypothetical protein